MLSGVPGAPEAPVVVAAVVLGCDRLVGCRVILVSPEVGLDRYVARNASSEPMLSAKREF